MHGSKKDSSLIYIIMQINHNYLGLAILKIYSVIVKKYLKGQRIQRSTYPKHLLSAITS